jgi:hypothetical protein
MRPLLCVVVAALLAGAAQAQILTVHFKDDKAAKKFKKYTALIGGEEVLIGEPVEGGGVILTYKDGLLSGVSHKVNADNAFFVLDPADPEAVPYKTTADGKEVVKKSSVVTVHGKYIERMEVRMRAETIETIAREYRLRLGRVEELARERDALEKGSAPWIAKHSLVLGGYERLISWLKESSFGERAEALQKEYEREAQRMAEEGTRVRAEKALSSIKPAESPEALASAAKAIAGDAYTFKVQESQHLRITYLTQKLSDAQIKELLVLGEKIIEGFRNQFVDPYVSESFPEHIPDGLFQEFYFGPEDVGFHERFITEYYGLSWGDEATKKRRLESTGNSFLRTLQPRLLEAWRLPEEEDLGGIIAHVLGHALADYHFNKDPAMDQPWMEEGLGYYISLEFLGRNTVTCREFRETQYGKQDEKEGYKEVILGYRDILTKSALDEGPRIDRVMLKNLVEMENADLAKSWSFFEYVARTGDLAGQRWLRSACEKAHNKASFLNDLRPISEELYGVKGEDVYKVLDDRWRAYAEAERDKQK